MNEIWKPIIGFVGFYEVSNCGRVRSVDRTLKQIRHGKECNVFLKGIDIKPSAETNKYLGVTLYKKNIGKRRNIHCLVAETFIGGIRSGDEVNHLDHNKQNNTLENLEIVSRRANQDYSMVRYKMAKKLNRDQVLQIKYALAWGEKSAALAKQFGVSRININAISFGKTWRHVNLSDLAQHD
jgi:hypothetical protein